jgi:hypothetical protein
MSSAQDNLQAVRHIEETVLDQHYRRFDLIYRNDEVAIPALLRMFGDLVRGMIHDRNLGTDRQRQSLMDDKAAALGHCFRWLAHEPVHTIQLAINSPQAIAKEAFDLLNWGDCYHELYLDHVALSRGEKVAKIDKETRTIEIRYRNPFDPFFYLAQRADEIDFISAYYASLPLEELKTEFRSWSNQRRTRLCAGLSRILCK